MSKNLLIENDNCHTQILSIISYLIEQSGAESTRAFFRMFPSLQYIVKHAIYDKEHNTSLRSLYRLAYELQLEFRITPYEITVHPHKQADHELDFKELATQWLNICIDACNRGLLIIKGTEYFTHAGQFNWSLPLASFNNRSKPHCPIMRTVLALLTSLPAGIQLIVNGDGLYCDGLYDYPVIEEEKPTIEWYQHCIRCGILRPNTEYRAPSNRCTICLAELCKEWRANNPESVKLTNNKSNKRYSKQKLQVKEKVGKNLVKGIAINLRKLKDGE